MVRQERLAYLPHLAYNKLVKTLTVRLPDALVRRIEQESITRRVSKSEIVRERLEQPALPPVQDGNLRAILEESWAAKVSDEPRRFRSPHKQKLAEMMHE